MHFADTGPLYARIGELIAAASEDPRRHIFFYTRVDEGTSVGTTLAEDRGDHVFYRLSPEGLADAVLALWNAQTGSDRWVEMLFVMENGKFNAKLFYADMLDPAENEFDRIDRVAIEVLGDKPARCDPLPHGPTDGGYTFEL